MITQSERDFNVDRRVVRKLKEHLLFHHSILKKQLLIRQTILHQQMSNDILLQVVIIIRIPDLDQFQFLALKINWHMVAVKTTKECRDLWVKGNVQRRFDITERYLLSTRHW